jgi:FixJ family two-component response regulator
MSAQGEEQPVVFVIDDDASIRDGLKDLFNSVALDTKTFGSAAEFLRYQVPDSPCCIVLDVRLPGMSGLDFQSELSRSNRHTPIVFMTGHGDIPMTVQAMKAGAVEFLPKPFRDQDMLDAVQRALELDRDSRKRTIETFKLRATFETLSAREREIMRYVAAGLLNKQTAAEVGLSEVAVKVHRGHMMRKMGAKSLAELVRMATALGIGNPKPD